MLPSQITRQQARKLQCEIVQRGGRLGRHSPQLGTAASPRLQPSHTCRSTSSLATGADYALALKANQRTLLPRARALVDAADPAAGASQPPAGAHDRIESRSAIVVPADGLDFPGVAAVARIESRRKPAGQPETHTVRLFLLSTPLSPERMLDVARTHWSIENQPHRVLDVDFRENVARSRKDHAPQNIAILRKLALDLLRHHPDKGSIKGKIKRAGWNDAFLLSLLGHMQ